jgi:hypothetical protein
MMSPAVVIGLVKPAPARPAFKPAAVSGWVITAAAAWEAAEVPSVPRTTVQLDEDWPPVVTCMISESTTILKDPEDGKPTCEATGRVVATDVIPPDPTTAVPPFEYCSAMIHLAQLEAPPIV